MPRIKTRKEELPEQIENAYLPKPSKIISFQRESPDCFLIRLDIKSNYMPGQFFQVSVPGIGEAPISVASCSNEFLDLNIREVGNLTRAVAKMKKGDTIYIRGPYGNGYSMEKFLGKDLIVIGGGSGVAPLKGIISYVEKHRKDFGNLKIFFGFRTPSDILFKDSIKSWESKYDVHIAVERKDKNTRMHCDVCFVTDSLDKSKLAAADSVVFICGPPVMLEIAVGILKKKGFSDQQIYVSEERLMHCGLGVCGHCMIRGKYTCKDGPVFRYDQITSSKTN